MSRLLTVLLAALTLTLLVAGAASAADIDKANELVAEANALADQHYDLDMRAGELLEEAFALDPAAPDAGDALPLLEEVETILAEMKQRMASISVLWAQAGALAARQEQAIYAHRQQEIAETYLEAHAVTSELLTRYKILYDAERVAGLTDAEFDDLDQEFVALGTQSDELYARLESMEAAADRYYTENRLDESPGGSLGWIGLIASLTVASGFAVLCGVLAGRKNRNVIGWGVLGFLAGVIGVLAVLVVKKVEPAVGASSIGTAPVALPSKPAGASTETEPSVMAPPPDPSTAAAPADAAAATPSPPGERTAADRAAAPSPPSPPGAVPLVEAPSRPLPPV